MALISIPLKRSYTTCYHSLELNRCNPCRRTSLKHGCCSGRGTCMTHLPIPWLSFEVWTKHPGTCETVDVKWRERDRLRWGCWRIEWASWSLESFECQPWQTCNVNCEGMNSGDVACYKGDTNTSVYFTYRVSRVMFIRLLQNNDCSWEECSRASNQIHVNHDWIDDTSHYRLHVATSRWCRGPDTSSRTEGCGEGQAKKNVLLPIAMMAQALVANLKYPTPLGFVRF